jgi:alpha-tubulin suppressor-like RCC1 family protein
VAAVAAASEHTCAVTVTGELLCWGQSVDGGLDEPLPESTLPNVIVTAVAVGDHFTCALTGQGVMCQGALTPSMQLLGVSGLTAGARHLCIISQQGKALCWGDNESGQLGIAGADGGFVGSPTLVGGIDGGVTQIAAGSTHTCARSGGHVYCWGQFDPNMSTPFDSPVPHEVLFLGSGGPQLIASGNGESCATDVDHVFCWGKTSQMFTVKAVALAVGDGFGCFVADDGTAQCWGTNTHGQLGVADAGTTPGPFTVLHGATAISCGRAHACAIGDNLQLWCWGEGAHDKLGSGNAMDAPVPVHVSN